MCCAEARKATTNSARDMKIFFEPDPARKRELQERLTAMLPQWFGQPASNAHYAMQAEILDGYVAESEGIRRGMLLLKWIGPISAEVYWMAVDPNYHRSGVGRALMEAAIEAARKREARFLFVMTLHPKDPYEPYQRTRRFYEAMGFVHVVEEQFPANPRNPTAWFMKQL